jgi:1-pyrroline-5-carboxylate dehydrogenase
MTTEKKLTYVDLLADETIHDAYERAADRIGSELGRSHPMYINGAETWADAAFTVTSPFDTEILVGRFQQGGGDHVRAAIAAARAGLEDWSAKAWRERTAIIRETADRLDDQKFLLSALVTYECGKNRYEALAEVSEAVDLIRYYADVYEKNEGYIVPMSPESPGAECRSVMRPHGVWAVISPFNFPLALAAGMAGAALVTGNTVVLKPTSTAPGSALKLYEACRAGGVPRGAIQFITGPGSMFGETIVSHPDIDGIAFTGSRDVGMWLEHSFTTRQPYPKPVISEMGSKNPVIVTVHADLGKAVDGVVKAAFGFSGQKCSATSRVYVQEPVFSAFLDQLTGQTRALVIGDPRKKATDISPIIEEKALQTYEDAVEQVKRDGGTIVTGGRRLSYGEYARGYFVEPTIVTGLRRDHPLVKKELFVPFVILDTFITLDEALREANATDYGLTAGIFSEDEAEIAHFFSAIQFGVTYANRRGGATTGAWPGSQSFGGWKASGSTGRGVGGPYYLLNYLREQAQTRIHALPQKP